MKILGIRYCSVSKDAAAFSDFLEKGLGMPRRTMDGEEAGVFAGGIFPAGDSWVELWEEGPDMPACTMLQIVVDDADAMADHARANGVAVNGPVDAHGERIYYATAPNGLPVSFQSAL